MLSIVRVLGFSYHAQLKYFVGLLISFAWAYVSLCCDHSLCNCAKPTITLSSVIATFVHQSFVSKCWWAYWNLYHTNLADESPSTGSFWIQLHMVDPFFGFCVPSHPVDQKWMSKKEGVPFFHKIYSWSVIHHRRIFASDFASVPG